MLRDYYRLAKPNMVYGNLVTTLAGFLFASVWHDNAGLLLATLAGLAFVIASACVFNNCLDRDIDKRMARTEGRALASGRISLAGALLYGAVLGVLGFFLLTSYVNAAAAFAAFVGFFFYLGPYSLAKRYSHWGAAVGSISGATPIVVGYVAVSNHFDSAALILFLIMALWQMPHFYAIAIYRLEEYKAAGIPVFPARKSLRETKWHILAYTGLFAAALISLFIYGYAGYFYLACALILGAAWLILAVRGFFAKDSVRWARVMFLSSLVILMVWCAALALSPLLP